MQAYLSAQDDDMWFVITDEPMKIKKANTVISISDGAPRIVEKPRCECKIEDKKKANLDNVAKDIIFKTLDKNIFSIQFDRNFIPQRNAGSELSSNSIPEWTQTGSDRELRSARKTEKDCELRGAQKRKIDRDFRAAKKRKTNQELRAAQNKKTDRILRDSHRSLLVNYLFFCDFLEFFRSLEHLYPYRSAVVFTVSPVSIVGHRRLSSLSVADSVCIVFCLCVVMSKSRRPSLQYPHDAAAVRRPPPPPASVASTENCFRPSFSRTIFYREEPAFLQFRLEPGTSASKIGSSKFLEFVATPPPHAAAPFLPAARTCARDNHARWPRMAAGSGAARRATVAHEAAESCRPSRARDARWPRSCGALATRLARGGRPLVARGCTLAVAAGRRWAALVEAMHATGCACFSTMAAPLAGFVVRRWRVERRSCSGCARALAPHEFLWWRPPAGCRSGDVVTAGMISSRVWIGPVPGSP
ncbi:hypothetical protein F511_35704 [Dorcoceras hygrometricum]|uniref:Uncharacterized protein n=1 Tax=Dorcoceras hygrometricum TaxID=472368 RepID=A0A2Z7C781_9LAMI|nr:hypothetical protein F511_35704 [Dorcoceras hygrometricum]